MSRMCLLFTLFLLFGCEQVANQVVKEEKVEVIVFASGELESKKTAIIAPPSISRMWQYQIKQLLPENSQVKKGELLVSFDDKKITDRLFDKQVELDRAQKELDNKKIKEVATEQELVLAVAEKKMEFEKAKRKAEIVDNSRSENDRKKAKCNFCDTDFLGRAKNLLLVRAYSLVSLSLNSLLLSKCSSKHKLLNLIVVSWL